MIVSIVTGFHFVAYSEMGLIVVFDSTKKEKRIPNSARELKDLYNGEVTGTGQFHVKSFTHCCFE